MRKIHFLSGIIITCFVGLHLFNHAVSLYGVAAHIEWMEPLRKVYRNTIIESVLLVSVIIQIISGLSLFQKQKNADTGFFHKLHIWSGLYLAIFLVIHVTAVMAGRFILKLDTNFYFGAAGLNAFPFNLFFIPYYILAIIAFFGHIAAIHSKKAKQSFLGLTPVKQSIAILVMGICITMLIIYGLTNRFQGIEIPESYHILIGK